LAAEDPFLVPRRLIIGRRFSIPESIRIPESAGPAMTFAVGALDCALDSFALIPMTDSPKNERKATFDALLLKLPGVSARKINGLDGYFVSDKMFACISGDGLGLRLPSAVATELHFSRADVSSFSPGGVASTREWIQINRPDAADYSQDIELIRNSIDFVKAGRR
jgi:hypothetical protein